MENKFEQLKITENQGSVLEMEEIKKFASSRNIDPEDFHLIEEMFAFPKEMRIVGLHNLFNMGKERSDVDLENSIQSADNEQSKAMYETALRFCKKYDWMTSMNLVRALERV